MAWRFSRDDLPDLRAYRDYLPEKPHLSLPDRPRFPWERKHRLPWQSSRAPMPWENNGWLAWPGKRKNTRLTIALGLGAAALVGAAAGAALLRRERQHRAPDSAASHSAPRGRFGDHAAVPRSVTVKRPRTELFKFWRDFQNFPEFMENVEDVQPAGDDRFIWTFNAPGGQTVVLETEIAEERQGQVIAWRSVEGSDIESEGRVTFKDAPAGRGTIVTLTIAYVAPGGKMGRFADKLFPHEPGAQARRELKRFKALMESGENPAMQDH